MGDAYERKIRPVSEALDGHNYKSAIKLAQTALQKYKDDPLLRALRAFALFKIGRLDEAVKTSERLAEETLAEETVLQLVGVILRSAGKGRKATAAYAAASAANPNDIGLLRAVFAAYVRDLNFAKQQQVALKLQRLDSRDEKQYAWWAIVSLMLQARAVKAGETDSGISAEQLLQLAKGMAKKRITKGAAAEGHEAMSIYLTILEEQGDQEEVLAVLNGDLGVATLGEVACTVAKAKLLEARGESATALELAKNLCKKYPEDWTSQKLLIELQRRTEKGGGQGDLKLPEWADLKADSADKKAAERRSVLVRAEHTMHLLRLLNEDGVKLSWWQAKFSSVSLLACFEQWSSFASCATDMRPYTKQLSSGQRQMLMDKIWLSVADLTEGPEQADLAGLRQLAAAYKVESDMGLPKFESSAAALDHAKRVMKLFGQTRHLYSSLDEKERGPADELPIVASTALIRAWKHYDGSEPALLLQGFYGGGYNPIRVSTDVLSQGMSYTTVHGSNCKMKAAIARPKRFLQALLALEASQVRRKRAAGLRIAAAVLYSLFGAVSLVSQQIGALEIKHIQHDSISGHLHLPVVLSTLHTGQAEHLILRISNLYENHLRDFGDTLLLCFTSGNYSKALEFVDFLKRIERSFGRLTCIIESNLLHLCNAALSQPLEKLSQLLESSTCAREGAQQLLWKPPGSPTSVSFNEDLEVRPSWLPPSTCGPLLTLADWWQPSEPSPSQSGAQEDWWWSEPRVLETACQQALQYKEDCLHQLRHRALVLELLNALLSPAEEASARIRETNSRVLELEGLTDDSLDDWMASLESRLAAAPLTKLCHLLDTALSALAASSLEASQPNRCKAWSRYLGSAHRTAARRIAEELVRSAGCSLPGFGAGWILAASYVYSASWLGIFLQAVHHRSSKKSRKSKQPKQTQKGLQQNGSESQVAEHYLPFEAAELLQSSLLDAAQHIKEAFPVMASEEEVLEKLLETVQPGEDLWSWEEDFDVSETVELLIQEECALSSRLRDRLDNLINLYQNLPITPKS